MTSLDKYMMSEWYEIAIIWKCHHSLAIFLWNGEEIFEDVCYLFQLLSQSSHSNFYRQHDNTIIPMTLTLFPSLELKLWKMRWGNASDTVPWSLISCRSTTLCNEKYAVGPYGKWQTTMPSEGNQRLGRIVQIKTIPWQKGRLLTRLTSVFVKDNQICNLVCSTRIHNFFHNVVTTIYTLWIGENKSHFLWKLLKTTAWISRSCD